MRKIIVLTFLTLDGVMQSPGGSTEDPKDGFTYGGWAVSYWDDIMDEEMGKQMGGPFDLLLGRTTYDIFAGSWPQIDPEESINKVTKYVVTSKPTPPDDDVWKNSIRLDQDFIKQLTQLKKENGPDIQVHGSGQLIQSLLKHDLVDELWLKIFPVILGKGQRLFDAGTVPTEFKLKDCKTTSTGVIIAVYEKSGEVKFGSL